MLDDQRPNTEFSINFDGERYPMTEGESIAATLLKAGKRSLRSDPSTGKQRGIYCGIGHCYECRVWVKGAVEVRSCITPAVDGQSYCSQPDLGEGQTSLD